MVEITRVSYLIWCSIPVTSITENIGHDLPLNLTKDYAVC